MSTYVREKVIRLPYNKTGLQLCFKDSDKAVEYLENSFKSIFSSGTPGKFQVAPTESLFIDYVIESEWDACSGEWSKIRELLPAEKERFGLKFRALMPNADLDALRVVEYCWYDCCEAPDYYEKENDSFYEEIN